MPSIRFVIEQSAKRLAAKGIPSSRLDSELLVAHVFKMKRLEVYLQGDRLLQEREWEVLRPLIQRRSDREPLQYILAEAVFAGLTLKVDRRALIPRPETEELVELVIAERGQQMPSRILDLGTGCGAIAIALAVAFRKAEITAVDVSLAALCLARENAASYGLEKRVCLIESNWFEHVSRRFDLVISNPPYLAREEWEATAPEIKHYEPRQALVASGQGTAALLHILGTAPSYLEEGGCLALETGIAHHERLIQASRRGGYARCVSRKDLSKRDRFFLALK